MPYLYKLKLLNSPLYGRELKLREGIFRIGSESAESDIVLALEGGIDFISLAVQAEGVVFTTPGAGWIGDRSVESIEKIPLRESVMMAGVALVLGHVDDDLSHFTQWQYPDTSKGSKTGIIIAVFFCLLTATFCAIYWNLLENEDSRPRFNPQQYVEQYQKQHALSKITVNWLTPTHLDITGWCRHESNLTPLLTTLRQHQVAFTNQAICQDSLLRNVQYAIQLYGYANFQVEPGDERGEVVINGAVDDDGRWQEVMKLLSTMPGLKKWTVVNQSESQTAQIIQILKKNHLLGKLSIRKINGRIIISGKLNDKDVDLLANIIRKFMQSNPAAAPMVYQNIQATNSASEVLPAPIISVGGNESSPYIELSNGMRLQKGAALPSGYIIRNIDSSYGVELSRHGLLVHIPLGF
jgi:type III secretion protein D